MVQIVELILLIIGIILISIGAYLVYSPAGLIVLGFLLIKISWPENKKREPPGGDS